MHFMMNEKQKLKQRIRVWSILKEYWLSEQKWFALPLLIMILIMSIIKVRLFVWLNLWHSEFYNALEQKNYPVFLNKIYTFVLIAFMLVSSFSVIHFSTNFLSFRWRSWLTQRYLVRWFEKNAYYHVFNQAETIDNPDQRLSQDIALFTEGVLGLFIVVFNEIFTLVAFINILWGISTDSKFQIFGKTFDVPGYLIWVVILYSLVGTLIIAKIGKPLIHLDFEQEKCEADFRYSLMRVREYREEIAMQNGEEFEKNFLKNKFFKITQNYYKILKRNIVIDFFQHSYFNFGTVFPYLVAAPIYFSGKISLGSLMRIPNAFSSVLNAFSMIIKKYEALASLKATISRITTFVEKMEEAHTLNNQIHAYRPNVNHEEEKEGIFLQQLKVITPKGEIIHHNISLDIQPGEHVLIMGRSGLGKSSLFRILKGLWGHGQSKIIVPHSHCFFLPQKPYHPFGTLRDCLNYPTPPQSLSLEDQKEKDAEICSLLRRLDLEKWTSFLDHEADWQKILSLGEQQRVQIIRCILNRPKNLFMDEPTSALDIKNEKKVFELLFEKLPHLTLLTIGHSESLKTFHHKVIVLEG